MRTKYLTILAGVALVGGVSAASIASADELLTLNAAELDRVTAGDATATGGAATATGGAADSSIYLGGEKSKCIKCYTGDATGGDATATGGSANAEDNDTVKKINKKVVIIVKKFTPPGQAKKS